MAFNADYFETDLKTTYKGVDYRVVDTTSSGVYLVVKEEDVINNNYPLTPVVIPTI